MNKNFQKLLNDFKNICDKKWIPSITNGHGTIGLTFEHELGKKIDTKYTPDYEDIEIKCTTRYSRYPITLFSLALDGPTNKEIVRLNTLYGSIDIDFKDKKTLIRKIRVGELSELKNGNYLSLKLEKDKLYITVYNKDKKLIEKISFVYLESIKKHLLIKLNNLSYIKASKKKIDNLEHYRFFEIYFYKLKSFDTFIKLLSSGNIEVTLNSRISKSGKDAGRYHNKNLVFQIKKKNIEKLFDLIYYYNNDDKINFYNNIQYENFQIL